MSIPTADDMAVLIADFRAKNPTCRKAIGHLEAVAKAKRTDEMRLDHMTLMLNRCVEEDIKAFGDD